MHRFIHTATVEGVRLALRSDGAVWALAGEPDDRAGAVALQIDRGAGWLPAERIRLCHGDRLRLRDTSFTSAEVCALLGLEAPAPATNGAPGLQPVRASEASLEKARRNPGTGQIEPLERKQDE